MGTDDDPRKPGANEPAGPAKSKQAGKPDAAAAAPAIEHSPALRNAVHAGFFFVFAYPCGVLADPSKGYPDGRWWVAGFLLVIAIFNLLILRCLDYGKRLAREDEGVVSGLWLYPLALSVCYSVLPSFAATGAWAVMAAGDAAASFAGRAMPVPKLPWSEKKSWAGMAGFILASVPICFVALYFVPCPWFLKTSLAPEIPYVWTLAVIAAVCGAIAESLPTELNDNLSVPLSSGGALWLFALFLSWGTNQLPKDTPVQPKNLLTALAVNGALAAGVLLLKFADLAGTILGAVLGTIIFFFAQWQGYLLFLLFVLGGSLLSKAGLKYKEHIGAAEANAGKRGIGNVAANLLVPGLCCLAYPRYGGHGALLMAFAGSLSAAFADTASSEIGAFSKSLPRLITTRQPVPHGTNGAVSLLGMLAALGACLALAGVAWGTDFYALALHTPSPTPTSSATRAAASAVLIGAGLLGTLVDSFLGATVEDRIPKVGKSVVNFACTLTGAIAAGLCSMTIG